MKPPAKDKRPRDRWICLGWMRYACRPVDVVTLEGRPGQIFRVETLRGWVRDGNQNAPTSGWRTKNQAISESGRSGCRAVFVEALTAPALPARQPRPYSPALSAYMGIAGLRFGPETEATRAIVSGDPRMAPPRGVRHQKNT